MVPSDSRSRHARGLRARRRGRLRRDRLDTVSGCRTTCRSGAPATPSAARYRLGDGVAAAAWSRRTSRRGARSSTASVRVSSLQTGVARRPAGQPGRPAPVHARTPSSGRRRTSSGSTRRSTASSRLRARVGDDPSSMAALWMIGFEDRPERSAEICVVEIFGRDVGRGPAPRSAWACTPSATRRITDEFVAVRSCRSTSREFHDYAVEWTPEHVAFFVDGELVTVVEQSPGLPDAVHARHLRVPGDRTAPRRRGPYPRSSSSSDSADTTRTAS